MKFTLLLSDENLQPDGAEIAKERVQTVVIEKLTLPVDPAADALLNHVSVANQKSVASKSVHSKFRNLLLSVKMLKLRVF